jgi:hypothetical protein
VGVRYVQGSAGRIPDGRGGYIAVPHDGYSYFRLFTPTAVIANSFYIYDLSFEEVNRVRGTMGLVPLDVIP